MRIGVDLMGSDSPADVLLNAVIEAGQQLGSSVCLQIIASECLINQMHEMSHVCPNLVTEIAHEEILMDDSPLYAIRRKRGASLVMGIEQLASKKIDAFLSLGNTGALMGAATLSLKMLPSVERPALLACLPTLATPVAVLDIGANVTYKPHHLVQFAYMGIAYQQCTHNIAKPRIGLLNIGHEPQKGTADVQETYKALSTEKQNGTMDFIGNIEGREIFNGLVDVVVTDGFTGNILLKTAEGISGFALHKLQSSLSNLSLSEKDDVKATMQQHLDYSEYSGAILLGVDGIVVKCHGSSSKKAVINCILRTHDLVKNDLLGKLKNLIK
ncbi:MAG: phosphate acyltransferase PlsX [Parachlamydiales bacterium]|nr:phosphate acyltransferase PlsX [Parachlamydiales bacterium]